MKPRRALLAALVTTALLASPTPAYAVDSVDLSHPGSLERGEDVRLPHLVGDTVVDGERRIEVRNAVTLHGASGEDYIVSTKSRKGKYRIKRVTPDGEATVVLAGRKALYSELAADGAHLFGTDNRRRATITAYDATDGRKVSSARFRGYGFVVDAAAGTALVSSFQTQRTLAWDFLDGGRSTVVEGTTYVADLAADRIAYYTGDIYTGGCSVVTTVTEPDTDLWRSCRQRVQTFSPDGELLTSIHILTDGVGPGQVQLRESDGTRLVDYDAAWFAVTQWEDEDTLLLEANGRRLGAIVRADGTDVERASRVRRTNP